MNSMNGGGKTTQNWSIFHFANYMNTVEILNLFLVAA